MELIKAKSKIGDKKAKIKEKNKYENNKKAVKRKKQQK